jgi:hypothetical protein
VIGCQFERRDSCALDLDSLSANMDTVRRLQLRERRISVDNCSRVAIVPDGPSQRKRDGIRPTRLLPYAKRPYIDFCTHTP